MNITVPGDFNRDSSSNNLVSKYDFLRVEYPDTPYKSLRHSLLRKLEFLLEKGEILQNRAEELAKKNNIDLIDNLEEYKFPLDKFPAW